MRDTFTNLVLGVFLAIMIGWILVIGRPVILPATASLILAYIVFGLTELIARLPVVGPRLPAALRFVVAFAAIGGALFLLASIVISNVGAIVAIAPQYQDRLLAAIQTVATRLDVETALTWTTLRQDILARVDLQRALTTALASATAIVSTLSLVTIYAGFLLLEKGVFVSKIARLSDDPARVARIREVIGDINARIGAYLVTKTLINLLLGTVSYVIMRVAGIEFAGFWAILIGLFNYIPYVGSFVGVFFPVALSALQFGALGPVLAIAAALSAAQITVGNLVEPYFMGNSLNLSPFVILVSLVAWSSIWGIPGAILSAPLMASLVIVLSNFAGARPIAVLLSRDGDIAPSRHPRG